jgi:hypothetical protein
MVDGMETTMAGRIIKDDPTIHFSEMCDGFCGKVRRDNVEAETAWWTTTTIQKFREHHLRYRWYCQELQLPPTKYARTHQQNHPNMFHLYSLRPKALKQQLNVRQMQLTSLVRCLQPL